MTGDTSGRRSPPQAHLNYQSWPDVVRTRQNGGIVVFQDGTEWKRKGSLWQQWVCIKGAR